MSPQPLMPEETPKKAAARWFARRRSGAMTAQELRELEVWLDADAAHRDAYDHLARLWGGAEAARNDPEVMQMREAAHRAQTTRRWRAFAAVAAVFVLAVFGAAGVANWMTAGSNASPELVAGPDHQELRTSVGQTATMTLTDGSVVTLDSDTVLRTRTTWNRRYVELAKGRAFFRVAHQPTRPFVVLAGGRTVTALGTSFEVAVDRGKFQVTLVSGKVRVEQPKAEKPMVTTLKPGTKLVAPDDGAWKLATADIPRETSWVDGLLRFRDEPLGQVAGELNKYSRKKVIIDDPAVAARPIQGAFAAGDVEEFVRAAEAYGLARVVSDSSAEVVLAAPRAEGG
ncbi:MAG TPA: FecR domain-containing protein [Caulobacteraceae bacterium]